MIAAITDKQKKTFKSPQEARASLSLDKLGCVYVNAKQVFVVTVHGSGKFTREEWKA